MNILQQPNNFNHGNNIPNASPFNNGTIANQAQNNYNPFDF